MPSNTVRAVTITRATVFQVAWPIIIANISTPLLGLVDTAVIGNLNNPALIGAIAVGAMIFSFLYWGFGFLRMGTTGLVAQAHGASDSEELKAAFYRALLLGVVIGAMLVLLQQPISHAALGLISGSGEVETAALEYFQIRIWAAPVSLAHFAIVGYLLGCQDTRSLLLIQLLLNGTNILLDVLFVVGLGWEVRGIAAATTIAECIALTVGLVVIARHMNARLGGPRVPRRTLWHRPAILKMLSVNRDLMVRTLCLIFGFAWFTNQGAKAGDIVLATNAILLQFVGFSAFLLDGFALAAEALAGQAFGARDRKLLTRVLVYTTQFAAATAVLLALAVGILGDAIVQLLTNVDEVRNESATYLGWAIAAPLTAAWCYVLDGMFVGATRTRDMRNAMLVSLIIYLGAWWLLRESGNHGLWLSLHLYFVARGLSLSACLPSLFRSVSPSQHALSHPSDLQ